MGAIEEFYSNLYPTNLKFLPWTPSLYHYKEQIESLRENYYNACKSLYNRKEALLHALTDIGSTPFKDFCRKLGAGKNSWSVQWHNIDNEKGVKVYATKPKIPLKAESSYRINVSDNLFESVDIGNELAAQVFGAALTIFHDSVFKRDDFLKMPVPNGKSKNYDLNNKGHIFIKQKEYPYLFTKDSIILVDEIHTISKKSRAKRIIKSFIPDKLKRQIGERIKYLYGEL